MKQNACFVISTDFCIRWRLSCVRFTEATPDRWKPAYRRSLGSWGRSTQPPGPNAISPRQCSLAGHELKRQLYPRKREKENRDKMRNKREAHAKERPSEKCDVIKTACLHLTPSDSTRLRNEWLRSLSRLLTKRWSVSKIIWRKKEREPYGHTAPERSANLSCFRVAGV